MDCLEITEGKITMLPIFMNITERDIYLDFKTCLRVYSLTSVYYS